MSDKKKGRVVYMHTLDGFPAQYDEGEQVCYAGGFVERFADSLRQVRREQQKSIAWRHSQRLSDLGVYGYVRVRLP